MIYSNAKEARRINHGSRRKKRGYVTYSTDREYEVSKMFVISLGLSRD